MDVDFTGSQDEVVQTGTFVQQFPMDIRSAWSQLTEALVQFTLNITGEFFSQFPVPGLGWWGNSDLIHPQLRWRRSLRLPENAQLRGNLKNIGSESAANIVFFCQRPDITFDVKINESREFRLLLDLGLNGIAQEQAPVQTQQIEYDLLVWGMHSTTSTINVLFRDTYMNINWSEKKLPIGAYAGIQGQPEPIIWFPIPYYLPRNTTLRAEFDNDAEETGQYIELICERKLS
jgi:hypothetical protein